MAAVQAGAIYPCNPWTSRSESTKLSTDPKGEKLVYTNGRAVVIRDLNDPSKSHVYTQHTQSVTVARISPSGYYCASADVAGNVRVWDVTNPENVLKFAGRPISGKINDLAWDSESKRIIVGGEGKDKFGAAFFMDSGSSCGEITGHSKSINAVSIKSTRPFKAISGSDDNSIGFHSALPFKYDKLFNQVHTRFVRDVGYSPNGELFASCGSDGKLLFFDGKTGEIKGEAKREETSSLMALSWSKDSKKVVVAALDGNVTIWDAESFQSIRSWNVGNDLQDQQNGVVWINENTIASVSLSGVINIFDPSKDTWKKLYGPTKAITASTLDTKNNLFYTGSFDGTMKALALGKDWEDIEGNGHSARVSGLASSTEGDDVWSVGWDERAISIKGASFSSKSIGTKSQPFGIATTSQATYIATSSELEIHLKSGSSLTQPGNITAVAAHSSFVAFGEGKVLNLATLSGSEIKVEKKFEESKGDILSIAFSKDGKLLAAGDNFGRIILVDVEKKEAKVTSRWTFHSGRIVDLDFTKDGRRLVSAGMDESIYVWDTEKVMKNIPIKNAHPGGVAGVSWIDNETIISSGQDGCARTWKIPPP